MNYIAGIDGAKCGWVCISAHINNLKNPKFFFAKTLTQLINDKVDLVLIDMPVGLDMSVSYTHLTLPTTPYV